MKAWKEPKLTNWGMDYRVGLTDEFENIIELAKNKIYPFVKKEISRLTYYFTVKGDEVNEYDCCDNIDCIKKSKKAIRGEYGKGTHIEEHCYSNDGDHDKIEVCSVCGKPLNEFLTWCEYELEYLEENKPYNTEFLINEAFLINAIFQSSHNVVDCRISQYSINKGGEILEVELNARELFFQRIAELAQSVINTDFASFNER